MNYTGNTSFIFYADTTSITQESLPVKLLSRDTLSLDIQKPVVKAIPEIPRRFKKVSAVPVKELKKFIPSAEDSVLFNLIGRKQQEQGVIQNTVVNDFLNPILRSDKQWISSGVATEIESVIDVSLKKEDDVPVVDSAGVSEKTFVVADSALFTHYKDSAALQQDTTVLSESVEVVVAEEKPIESPHHSRDVISILLILSVGVTGVIRMMNYKYLRELFSAVLFSQHARKMQKTGNLRNQKAAFVLNILFLFNASIFIYELVTYYNMNTFIGNDLLIIPMSMAVLLCFGIVKSALYLFVGFVFESQRETRDYLFVALLHNKIFALIILPIILVVPYIDAEMWPFLFNIGLGSFVLLYFMQLFRGIVIILKNSASLFYMFLYLCGLEILPLIIMYRVIVR